MHLTGLDWQYFNWQQMEFFGDLNLLKTGIAFADLVTTVSPSYAHEIQHPSEGCGLDGVLRSKANRLLGIVNGVDYSVWDPFCDPHIASRYSIANWREGKRACKRDLQQRLQLPVRDDVPVIGLVGRLADQKGWSLVTPLMERWLDSRDVQWVILGNGEARFARSLSELAHRRPDRVGARFEFSEPLAHAIEAGCDIFLMPSRYEPCGLNQLYSLRYGTLPVVHAVGGLRDTVFEQTQESAPDEANGFVFSRALADELFEAIQRAISLFRKKDQWKQLQLNAMNKDFSWDVSAKEYLAIYTKLSGS